MTTHVLDAEPVAAHTQRRTALRNPFFTVMSTVTLLIVLSGFAPTLYLRPVFKPMPIPGYLFLHGIVLTSWFIWFFVQTVLIQPRRTALHRRLGAAGAVLAAVVPFAGLMASFGVVGRVAAFGIDLDADASVLAGLGVSGVTVMQFLSGVFWGNLTSAVSLAALAWTGILLRGLAIGRGKLLHPFASHSAFACHSAASLNADRVVLCRSAQLGARRTCLRTKCAWTLNLRTFRSKLVWRYAASRVGSAEICRSAYY